MGVLPGYLLPSVSSVLDGAGTEWTLPGIAAAVDPRTTQTPALDLIDAELEWALATPNARLIITMPPQEGKSTRVGRDFLIRALIDNPDTRVVAASYGQRLAERNGRQVRNAIAGCPQFGLSVARDHGSVSEWGIEGYAGGVLSVGRGAGVSGRPADLLVIDDPLKDQAEAESELVRELCWEWWTHTLSARFGADTRVVLIMTRWHADDLAGRLIADGGWKVLNIPAQCDNPDSDPLGRRPGEFMVSARGRTREQWELRKRTAGSRAWTSLYQGRPSPPEGGMVKRDWWDYYATPLWEERTSASGEPVCVASGMDEVLISADLAFKGTEASDRVAIGVWGRRGSHAYLLDLVCGWHDFVTTVREFQRLARKWPQATLKLVEDAANGPALISMLSRRVPGIVPITPRGSKVVRLLAVAPLIEARDVHLPVAGIAPWVTDFVEEFAGFPNASHDDQVDMTTQALDRLLLRPLAAGTHAMGGLDDDYRIGY